MWRKISFDFGSRLRVLATKGKWTTEHDVSQDVYNYIYIGKNISIYIYIIVKVKFQKLITSSMLYTYLISIIHCLPP